MTNAAENQTTRKKPLSIATALFGILAIAGIGYYLLGKSPEVEVPEDSFPGWENFGLHESYEVGDFIPVKANGLLGSPIITGSGLRESSTENAGLLELKKKSSFTKKTIDHSSVFKNTLKRELMDASLKKSLEGLSTVNFTVHGGQQISLAKGTGVLREVIQKMPETSVINMNLNLGLYDSILFLTEVMAFDSSSYELKWSKALQPEARGRLTEEFGDLGVKASWDKNQRFVVRSDESKNFLYKYEYVSQRFKEVIFDQYASIIDRQEKLLASRSNPVARTNWSSEKGKEAAEFTEVNAKLDTKGYIVLSGKQNSTQLKGSKGRITIDLLDNSGKVLESVPSADLLINGYTTNNFQQHLPVDTALVGAVDSIVIRAEKRK